MSPRWIYLAALVVVAGASGFACGGGGDTSTTGSGASRGSGGADSSNPSGSTSGDHAGGTGGKAGTGGQVSTGGSGGSGGASEADIIGCYTWFDPGLVQVLPTGVVLQAGATYSAIWSGSDPKYSFAWSTGYTDSLTRAANGDLSGMNNAGNAVSGTVTACPTSNDAIVGCYSWFNGGTVQVLPNGMLVQTGLASGPLVATWTQQGGTYTLNWANGFTDTLTLTAGGDLTGNVMGKRISCANADNACPSTACNGGSSSSSSTGGGTTCTGSPHVCSFHTTSTDCANSGCTWGGSCGGTARACVNFGLEGDCQEQGCDWDGTHLECTGIPSRCGNQDDFSCGDIDGCVWTSGCTGNPSACSAHDGSQSACNAAGCQWQ